MGWSYSLGTLIKAMEIKDGSNRRGSGGKALRKFFEDTHNFLSTFSDQMFGGFKRELLPVCNRFFVIN